MKNLIISFLFSISFVGLFSQKTFCDGWKAGFESGKLSLNDRTYIVPICPIPSIGGDTYEVGYSKGYEKATGKKAVVVSKSEGETEDEFCDGWEKGYTVAMNENDRGTFVVPVCPVARINQDDFDAGYIRGYNKAIERLGKSKAGKAVVVETEDQTFCDGWERGYQYGLKEWAIDNDETQSSRSTPICPVARVNNDTYQDGFDRGRQRAIEDMQ